jgi:hypothetical protein
LSAIAVCTAAAIALLALAGAARAVAPKPAVTRVSVVITRGGFVLSRHTVPLGVVIFTIVNRDPGFGQDFAIPTLGAGLWVGKSPVVLPNHRFTLRVRFRTRGRYEYFSTLHDQAEAGFVGFLTVR